MSAWAAGSRAKVEALRLPRARASCRSAIRTGSTACAEFAVSRKTKWEGSKPAFRRAAILSDYRFDDARAATVAVRRSNGRGGHENCDLWPRLCGPDRRDLPGERRTRH